jgi:site-specific DNA-methyltransferase (adenine-specific)
VFAECVAKLEPGGRIAVNVANLGRKPYRSLSADVIGILQDRLGLLLRGEVVWRKARGAGGNCAWGSFKLPANPVLRDLTERVVIASKGRFDRAIEQKARAAQGLPSVASTTADEFMDATLDVWELAPESAIRVNHPAPFPVELPLRLIDLYTYRDDVVLDPFMGSGTTAVAAVRSGRHYLGYDMDEGYARAARERVAAEVEGARSRGLVDRADRASIAARDLLVGAGFTVEDQKATKRRRFAGGLGVDWVALDAAGEPWLVLVAGTSTIVRTGLRRADVLFRTLGEAGVLTAAGHKVLVLTTDLPPARSAPLDALRTARGAQLVDVLELTAPGAGERLAAYAAGGVAAPVGDLLPPT